MHPIDWLIVIVLNGSIIAYGFYLARGTQTSSEWFLASRALPWWAIGLSMFATNVDNADIVSVTGKTFNEGLHILSVYALGSAVGGILAAFFVTPAISRAGFYTNAEYLEARFGVTTRVLSALIQLQYRSSMLGLMIYSIFLLLTGLQIVGPGTAWCLIILMVICAGIYTIWGGLKTVVWTDALQAIIMIIAGTVIFWTVYQAVGGWNGMEAQLREAGIVQNQKLADLPHIGRYDGGSAATSPYLVSWDAFNFNFGPFVVVIAWTIVGSGYWTVNHTQTMRLMGARSLWDMKMAALAGVMLSLPIMIGSVCLGVLGRALAWQHRDSPIWQTVVHNADSIYPLLANEYLGVGLKGLVVAGVFAAAISTFDSMGSALSAVFTRDLYARLFVPGRDDKHYVFVGRCATLAILFLGFAYLPFILLQRNMLDAFTTLIPVFVTPLFTIYVMGVLTNAHRRSGLIGLVIGSTYGLFALYCRESPKIHFAPDINGIPLWLTDRWGALGWSFLITSTAMVISTLCFGRQSPGDVARFRESGWLERSRESLPALREHPFRRAVPWWLNPNLYAVLLLAISAYIVFGLFW